MSGNNLETERQHILERMHASREHYRRALANGEDIHPVDVIETHVDGTDHPRRVHRLSTDYSLAHSPRHIQQQGNPVLRVIKEHPVLCGLAVAAILIIGPKRIARSAVTGGTTLAALTASNPSNVDVLGRLLTMAGAYVQGRTNQEPRR